MDINEQLKNLPPPKNRREAVQKSASDAREAVIKCVEFLRGCGKNSGRAGGAVKAVVSANMEAVGRAGSPHSNAGENP